LFKLRSHLKDEVVFMRKIVQVSA